MIQLKPITQLYFYRNSIGDEGGLRWVEIMKALKFLRVLEVSATDIEAARAEALAHY